MPESIIDADAKDVMWAIDFQFDATVDGHTRESLHSARRALVQRVHRRLEAWLQHRPPALIARLPNTKRVPCRVLTQPPTLKPAGTKNGDIPK